MVFDLLGTNGKLSDFCCFDQVTEPEPAPSLSFQARPGLHRCRRGDSEYCGTGVSKPHARRTWVWAGFTGWTGTGRTVSESDRARAYQTHAQCETTGPEPDPRRPSCQNGRGLGRSRTHGQTSVIRTCWDCHQAGGNQHGRGTQSRRSCPMGPDSVEFKMNRLEKDALGNPVIAGNLVYNFDGRRRHS